MPATSSMSSPGRYAQTAVVVLTLAVFGAAVGFVTLKLRDGLRQQVLVSRAETLAAVASLQLTISADELGVADAPGALLDAVLKTSKFRGVLAIRVFDAEKKFNGAVPLGLADDVPGSDWTERPMARLRRREDLRALSADPDFPAGDARDLLVEAWVPVRRAGGAALAGMAQFWMEGEETAAEFAALDRRLVVQAVVAWGAGAAVIVLTLGW